MESMSAWMCCDLQRMCTGRAMVPGGAAVAACRGAGVLQASGLLLARDEMADE
jgi:hypothetical protein